MRKPTATPGPTAFATPVSGGSAETDRDALLALYNATGGPSWTSNTNWLTAEPLAKWHGVTMDGHGRVVELWLNENGLNGSLPPELGLLARLELLDLSSNELAGQVPPQMGHLGNLWLMDLSGNRLSGTLPPEMGELGELGVLSLANNRLTGQIPAELNQLVALESLDLSGNEFTGCVSDVLRDAAGFCPGPRGMPQQGPSHRPRRTRRSLQRQRRG